MIWAAFPKPMRRSVRIVAAKDYWNKSALRRHIATQELNAVLIERGIKTKEPLAPIEAILRAGESLVIFPEGTRSNQRLPGTFKSGLHRLAEQFRHVELIPVYLENLNRSLPKGRFLPVPVTATVRFGTPLERIEGETKEAFLTRARLAVEALA